MMLYRIQSGEKIIEVYKDINKHDNLVFEVKDKKNPDESFRLSIAKYSLPDFKDFVDTVTQQILGET